MNWCWDRMVICRGLSRLSAAGGGLTEFAASGRARPARRAPLAGHGKRRQDRCIPRSTAGRLGHRGVGDHERPRGKRSPRPALRWDSPTWTSQTTTSCSCRRTARSWPPRSTFRRRRLTGDAIPVDEPVDVTPTANGNSTIAMGRDGARSWCFRSFRARLLMAARRTRSCSAISNELHEFTDAVPSPDRSHIAFAEFARAPADRPMLDVATGAMSRFSDGGARMVAIVARGWQHT